MSGGAHREEQYAETRLIGVAADDTTGAGDIGIMYRRGGLSVKITTYSEDEQPVCDTDVAIIDTDSRLDSGSASYDKVFRATRQLRAMGCTSFYKKTCSVFRGNIGSEFDAMLDALGETFALISLAFPENGRRTVNGIHTVNGELLELSAFAKDPVHPMRESDLTVILRRQTQRHVFLIPLDVVRSGVAGLRAMIERCRERGGYAIVDAEGPDDLRTIAAAAHHLPVLGGSSALAEPLAAHWTPRQAHAPRLRTELPDGSGSGVLIVAGSLTPQTKAQTAHALEAGVNAFTLDARALFAPDAERQAHLARVAGEAAALLSSGAHALVMSASSDEAVAETKRLGRERGLKETEVSRLVSAALADITDRIVTAMGVRRLVVAGGDTSGTVCRKLRIRGYYVIEEIDTGVPSGRAIGRDMLIVLKSGSFGGPDFLMRAAGHLQQISVQEGESNYDL